MPCISSYVNKGVVVYGEPASLKLEVSPAAPWVNGQLVTMTAIVKDSEGAAVPGIPVEFWCDSCENAYGYVTTNSQGVAVLSNVNLGYGWDCYSFKLIARILSPYISAIMPCSNVGPCSSANPVVTRLSCTCPATIPIGSSFDVSCFLEYSAGNFWYPLTGQTVAVYKKVGGGDFTLWRSGLTDGSGIYKVSDNITSPGTYTYEARFGGSTQGIAAIEGTVAAAFVILAIGGLLLLSKRRRK